MRSFLTLIYSKSHWKWNREVFFCYPLWDSSYRYYLQTDSPFLLLLLWKVEGCTPTRPIFMIFLVWGCWRLSARWSLSLRKRDPVSWLFHRRYLKGTSCYWHPSSILALFSAWKSTGQPFLSPSLLFQPHAGVCLSTRGTGDLDLLSIFSFSAFLLKIFIFYVSTFIFWKTL